MKNISIFGASKLGQRPWRPGRKFWAISIVGAAEIDFSRAEFEEGTTQMVAFSLFGGQKITVPKGIPVTLSGFSILGAREVKQSEAKDTPPATAKSLHINAISILGAVSVTE